MASVSATYTASDIQMDYMKLLITQLQNQNPLEPLDNNQMASQLAQFSQLQQLESMNSNFAEVLANTSRSYANSLIGKQVEFRMETDTGETQIASGIVDKVYNNVEGQIMLTIGEYAVDVNEVISVAN